MNAPVGLLMHARTHARTHTDSGSYSGQIPEAPHTYNAIA